MVAWTESWKIAVSISNIKNANVPSYGNESSTTICFNQSILKEISPGISLEGMMLKLKLQYLGHLMRRVDSLEKLWWWEGLWGGGEGDDPGWDGWMASLTRWTQLSVNSRSWWRTGRPGMLRFMGLQRVRHDWATELNWTELKGELASFLSSGSRGTAQSTAHLAWSLDLNSRLCLFLLMSLGRALTVFQLLLHVPGLKR